jgi:hypothetical protein
MASSLSRASGAREIEDDLLGLGVFLVQFLLDNAVGMQELARDVGENGGAAGRDAAFGGLDEQAREEFAQVLGRDTTLDQLSATRPLERFRNGERARPDSTAGHARPAEETLRLLEEGRTLQERNSQAQA